MLGRQRVAIGAGRAADDAALLIARKGGGFVPGLVVGHRAFDGEKAAVGVKNKTQRVGGPIRKAPVHAGVPGRLLTTIHSRWTEMPAWEEQPRYLKV